MRKVIYILSLVAICACNDETIRMETYDVHGIDVSHYQSVIDWEKVASQEIHFAFVKASEGITLSDSLFATNWKAIKQAGIKRGAYHFFRPEVSSKKQAYSFIKKVKLEEGDLPPVLDVEITGKLKKKALQESVEEWISIVEKEYKIKPILYTNLKMYHKYFEGDFNEYPIWIARYNSRIPYLSPGKSWDFWQYGNRGKVDGINGDVDFNVFHGSMEELSKLCIKRTDSVLSFAK